MFLAKQVNKCSKVYRSYKKLVQGNIHKKNIVHNANKVCDQSYALTQIL